MGILIVDKATGKAESGGQPQIDDATNKLSISHSDPEKIAGAIAMALLDEINVLRFGLSVPLLAISKEDWITKIKAKLQ